MPFYCQPLTSYIYRPAILLLAPILALITIPDINRKLRSICVGATVATLIFFTIDIFAVMVNNVISVPEWDFYLFWSYGRAAVEGLNPYVQDNLVHMVMPLRPSEGLVNELFFFYPPPSLFLFVPLGFTDIHTAYILWNIIQGVMLVLVIHLLKRLFWTPHDHIQNTLSITTLVILFTPTVFTIEMGQLNIILLLFVLLFWKDRDSFRGGIWLAIASFVKPIALFLLLYVLLKRKWQLFGSMLVSMAVISIVTILCFGSDMFISYFIDNPISSDMPLYLYTEEINQSILGNILRITNYDIANHSPYVHPLFIGAVLTLLAISSLTIYFLDQNNEDWLLGLNITLALLVFPKTLTHYSFLLLVPMLLLLKYRVTLYLNFRILTVVYMFIYLFVRGTPFVFFIANTSLYMILHGIAIYWILQQWKTRKAEKNDVTPSSALL